MNDSAHPSEESAAAKASLPMVGGRMCVCLPGLTVRLREMGIRSVRMQYQGANCSGGFVHMEFVRSDGTHLDPLTPSVHATVLQAVFSSLLSSRHPDWNEGNGSAGDFRWDVSGDSLIHTHYSRGSNGNERVTHHNL